MILKEKQRKRENRGDVLYGRRLSQLRRMYVNKGPGFTYSTLFIYQSIVLNVVGFQWVLLTANLECSGWKPGVFHLLPSIKHQCRMKLRQGTEKPTVFT